MALDWVNKLFWWRTPPKEKAEDLETIIARWESFIVSLQNILTWETPIVSLIYFASVNLVFWSIVCLECRLYGLIFFALLMTAVFDCLRYQGFLGACRAPPLAQSPENRNALTAEELCTCLRILQNRFQAMGIRMRSLRENHPALFCLITCGCCLLLAVIGKAVSGASIIYALLISIFTIPALCARYPEYWQLFCSCLSHGGGFDEYLPDNSDDTIRILNLMEEPPPSLQSPETQLYPDLSSMPSCENSLDGFLDPDVDLPSPRLVDDVSDTSDISEPIEITFKSKHFNGDGSSTSSGEDLSKGLRFRGKKIDRQDSSDSSESFELVSKDDL